FRKAVSSCGSDVTQGFIRFKLNEKWPYGHNLKLKCLVDEKMIPLCASPTIKELCFRNHFFLDRPEGLYPKIACKGTDNFLRNKGVVRFLLEIAESRVETIEYRA
ncbi:MAG: hypothetical protein RJA67_1658, partial [Bacteroidota bacterium]